MRGRQVSSRRSRLRVKLDPRSYDIVIGDGALEHAAVELVHSGIAPSARLVVISSRRVLRLHGTKLTGPLRHRQWRVSEVLVPDGERSKSLGMASKLYGALTRLQADRTSVLVALGGGVIGDLAGFVAATYLRGIRYVQAPTTLLAAIDSSVGGKTGVDLASGKNLVGAFHQPRLVLTDLSTLRTLPRRQIRSGLYEAIKCAVIADRRLFRWIEDDLDALLAASVASTRRLVLRCCAIKADVVERDEREGGLRRILNFGHTFGHAVEAELNYRRFTHGEAVGLGMIMASELASRLGLLAPPKKNRISELIRSVGPLPRCDDLRAESIYRRMIGDKKTRSGLIHFILPRRIGEVEVRADVPRAAVISTLQQFGIK